MGASPKATEPRAEKRKSTASSLAATTLILAFLLFASAGCITWTRGWIFFLVFTALSIAVVLYLRRVSPEMLVVRSRVHEGTKPWDQVMVRLLLLAMIVIPMVAALDDGRFHWSRMTWPVVGLGYVLLVAGMVLMTWAQTVNRFFEPGVRIQTDRGHHVVDRGPYAVIRHPGYFAASLVFTGISLSLGSWWALIPAGGAALALVIRTAWEDRTLRAELPGYADYAQRVRFRLIPGVW
ncbi:MAG TPA: isoprenylcysteine carboxylmethyltransferase family protein [Phycisphaerae bacterium]|nr:isoprenylcysteine carboxylmethyltransferase family protein [Phycisphaerae bacterium]